MLGLKFVDDGIEDEFDFISGVNDTLLAGVNIKYDGGDSPAYSIDRMAATDSEELYRSDDGYGRIFLNDPGESFKAISSTLVFGALRDGDSLSMKPYLMAEMVDYFLGLNTVTDIKEAFGQTAESETIVYPNPAVSYAVIKFGLPESADVTLSIFDNLGRLIRIIDTENMSAGQQELTWDLNDANGAKVNDGFYFYRLTIENQFRSSGKLLIQR